MNVLIYYLFIYLIDVVQQCFKCAAADISVVGGNWVETEANLFPYTDLSVLHACVESMCYPTAKKLLRKRSLWNSEAPQVFLGDDLRKFSVLY